MGSFACALETKNETDFHRELSRLPHEKCALPRSGRLIFAIHKESLLFADLVTFVTARL